MVHSDLIGASALDAVKYLANRLERNYTFSFTIYESKLPEQIGEIRDRKRVGDETFYSCLRDGVLKGELEMVARSITEQGGILGMNSTLIYQLTVDELIEGHPPPPMQYLFMLDVDRAPSEENLDEFERQITQRLRLNSGIMLRSSRRGIHFLHDQPIDFNRFLKLLGLSLLMNRPGDEWVDPRYVGHILEGLDDFVNIYYATLRLTPTKTNPEVPRVIRVI